MREGQDIELHVPLYVAMAMLGHLCLALRHPGTRGNQTRPMVVRVVRRLGQLLVAKGALADDELEDVEQLEAQPEGGPFRERVGSSPMNPWMRPQGRSIGMRAERWGNASAC